MADLSFEKEFLESHNAYRRQHGAPPLTLSRKLCSSAQTWADHLLSKRTLQHSDTENGENLFYTQSSVPKEVTGKEAVDKWYSEIEKYNFSRPGFTSGTGHFTQVVWKDSKEVGVGLATDGRTTIVVGQYYPAGNINSQNYFEKNVLPPGGGGRGEVKPLTESNKKPSPIDQTSPRPADSSGSSSNFEKEFLESHNAYRRQHGAPPLTLSRKLCSSAQTWADHLLSKRTLQHSDTENGENLFYTQSSVPKEVTGKEAVDKWYSEIEKYNFSRPGFTSGTGHFTQVVWKDSKEVGVGLATDGRTTIVVGQYYPAGNINSQNYFEKNVLPPGGGGRGEVKPLTESNKKPSPIDQTSPRPADSSGSSSNFEKEFLESHNAYRRQHGAPPLTLSRKLCSSAQTWADHLLSKRTLQHSDTENGENLFYTQSSVPKEVTGKEAVDKWYSEIEKYNFSRPGFTSGTGHFTQVVWKDSKEVGVGLATDGRTTIVVGQYYPAGNINSQNYFEKNVLPPGGGGRGEVKPLTESNKKPSPIDQTSPRPADSSGSSSNFEKEFLESHNAYRRQHGAPPLTLSRKLCSSAQTWADHLLSKRTLQHSDTENGENLFYTQSSVPKEVTGKEAVDKWYSEIEKYNFSRPGFTSGTGHFTQVVWKDSKEVGVGLATDGRTTIVVGQYYPAGNINSQNYFEKNVLPPGSSSAGSVEETEKPSAPSKASTHNPAYSPSDASDFQREALKAHNTRRQLHGAPPLQLNMELCRESQKWAEHLLSLRALKHSNIDLGENIWYKWSSEKKDVSGKEAVESWYSEIEQYDFSNPGFQNKTGHFTQVVWKDSKEMGIGKATDGKGMVIAVARYRPAGNITNPGYFSKNVLPPGTPPPEKAQYDNKHQGNTAPQNKGIDDPDSEAFAKEFLQACNERRSAHGALPLSLNPDISKEAQAWAETLLKESTLKHSDTQHGENIWAVTGPPSITVTGQEVVDSWYKELGNYDFSKSGPQPNTGHFTQLVWRSSRELGVGRANSGTGKIIVVVQFEPPGNITNPGYYARNVLPKGSKVTDQPTENEPEPVKAVPLPGKELEEFTKSLLTAQNQYRKQHGAQPLVLSSDLSKEAQDWAVHLVVLNSLKSSDKEYGQNLWYRKGSKTTTPIGSEVAESWYEESAKYSFYSPGFKSGTGNFTQMVWKSSKKVGIGLATDGNGTFICVAFFDPPGNITNSGYFRDNVSAKVAREL